MEHEWGYEENKDKRDLKTQSEVHKDALQVVSQEVLCADETTTIHEQLSKVLSVKGARRLRAHLQIEDTMTELLEKFRSDEEEVKGALREIAGEKSSLIVSQIKEILEGLTPSPSRRREGSGPSRDTRKGANAQGGESAGQPPLNSSVAQTKVATEAEEPLQAAGAGPSSSALPEQPQTSDNSIDDPWRLYRPLWTGVPSLPWWAPCKMPSAMRTRSAVISWSSLARPSHLRLSLTRLNRQRTRTLGSAALGLGAAHALDRGGQRRCETAQQDGEVVWQWDF